MGSLLERARGIGERLTAPARAHPRAALYALSFLIHLAFVPFLVHDWDGFVFIQTVQDFLNGRTPYQTVEAEASYIFVGDGVPVVNSWYAYPPIALLLMAPSYWLFTGLLGAAPWVERLGVKLPFVLGDLALAWVAAELVRHALRDEPTRAAARAKLVEKLVLFNPFLIFISAAWGMFDAWMMALAVGAVLALDTNRPRLAGVLFALAVLVKPFPALVGPLFLAFAWHRGGVRTVTRWVGAGLATGLAVCAPFFLTAPDGFLQQIVLNHAGRPPQGFTLAGIPLAFPWINDLIGTSLPEHVTPEAVSRGSFLVLLLVLALSWAQAPSMRSPARLVHASLVALTGMLLVSKVVNEQYFVMPVALAVVAFGLSGRSLHKWTALLFTVGGAVSGIFLGYHFLTFLPPDVAEAVLPFDPQESVPRLREALGWTDHEAYIYPTLVAAIALVPAFLLSLRLVAGDLLAPLKALKGWNVRTPLRVPPGAAAVLAVLLLVFPVTTGLMASGQPYGEVPEPSLRAGPIVGAEYRLWWHNPAHDPSLEYGNWRRGVSQVPEDGYFTTTAGKMRNDFRDMKDAGLDLVVYHYDPGYWPKLPALVRLAAEADLTTAPMVDLRALAANTDHRPRDGLGNALPQDAGTSLRDGTRDAIADWTSKILLDFAHFPSWWRVDGRPVVFVRDAHVQFYDAEGPVRDRMIDAAMRLNEQDVEEGRANATLVREDLEAAFPVTEAEYLDGNHTLWRRAYLEVHRAFWEDVRRGIEARYGPVYLIGSETWKPGHTTHRGAPLAIADQPAFDATFLADPADVWVFHAKDGVDAAHSAWTDATVTKAQHDRAAGHPVTVTLSPGWDDRALQGEHGYVVPHDGTRTLERQWDVAHAVRADVVLVATWNDFHVGNAVEPTREHDDAFVAVTRDHAARLREAPGAMLPRILLVTNTLGASFVNGSGDPDGHYSLSRNLHLHAEALGDVHAVDWNGPLLDDVRLTDYDLVVVEPGNTVPWNAQAAAFDERLALYMHAGGSVLLLGSNVGTVFGDIEPWTEPGYAFAPLRVLTPDGPVDVRSSPLAREHHVPQGASAYLFMEGPHGQMPAAWRVPFGNGAFAVTALRPQGEGEYRESDFPVVKHAVLPLLPEVAE